MREAPHLPKQIIEKIAIADLRRYLWLTGKRVLEFPVNPAEVFKVVFDLDTFYIDFDSVELRGPNDERLLGVLYPVEKKIAIHTGQICAGGAQVSDEIKRFSLAHEGGHYSLQYCPQNDQLEFLSSHTLFLRPERYIPYMVSPEFDEFEVQANHYAAALLMPRKSLEKAIFDISTTCYGSIFPTRIIDFKILSGPLIEKFGVSKSCLKARLRTIGVRCSRE
jgi:hypothetical protein